MFKLVDIFSGPGGLGEGFSAFEAGRVFKVGVSAEMESSAHQTLTLRSLYRLLASSGDASDLTAYYDFCNDAKAKHPRDSVPNAWELASGETQQLTLGEDSSNRILGELLDYRGLSGEDVVVVGGPPCQAYSLVGRARNKGVEGYVAADDHRHYLYKEYLRILDQAKPVAFVMENVKGLLSSRIDGKLVFHDILRDLLDPSRAIGKPTGISYTIHSLVKETRFERGMEPEEIDVRDFIVKSEDYGIPQRRHRVILIGVREELNYRGQHLLSKSRPKTVQHAIHELTPLRSRLSKNDGAVTWRRTVLGAAKALLADAEVSKDAEAAAFLKVAAMSIGAGLPIGDLRMPGRTYSTAHGKYFDWVRDPRLSVWLNHEARAHMDSDLGRYLYAAAFARFHGRAPKGHLDFTLKGLAPAHKNWKTGKFPDRFRVQLLDEPSTTITSHIAKDGHYFIHPDFSQCRSLTAREAARLQTFPDNYFFQGNRTQQFHQVGNAVPPLLAVQIAEVVSNVLLRTAYPPRVLAREKVD